MTQTCPYETLHFCRPWPGAITASSARPTLHTTPEKKWEMPNWYQSASFRDRWRPTKNPSLAAVQTKNPSLAAVHRRQQPPFVTSISQQFCCIICMFCLLAVPLKIFEVAMLIHNRASSTICSIRTQLSICLKIIVQYAYTLFWSSRQWLYKKTKTAKEASQRPTSCSVLGS